MPVFHCNPGHFTWGGPRSGDFRPDGKLHSVGKPYTKNPAGWTSTRVLAGRMIVGFSVGQEPRWTVDDLIPIVKRVREEQTRTGPDDPGQPDASFLLQKGIYRHKDPDHGVVIEDGAQVIIIDLLGRSDEEFQNEMLALAEIVAQELEQESVIVEIQVNGQTQLTMGVTPY